MPRTRVGGCAAALSASAARIRASLLRRLDAIFAYCDALGDEFAVVADTRAAENRLARLEVGAAARDEGEVFGFRRHHDFLLAVLVFECQLVATANLGGARDVGVGHQ